MPGPLSSPQSRYMSAMANYNSGQIDAPPDNIAFGINPNKEKSEDGYWGANPDGYFNDNEMMQQVFHYLYQLDPGGKQRYMDALDKQRKKKKDQGEELAGGLKEINDRKTAEEQYKEIVGGR